MSLHRPARYNGRTRISPRVIGPAGYRLLAQPRAGVPAVERYFTTYEEAIMEAKRLGRDPYYRRVVVKDQHGKEVFSATAHREVPS